MRTQTQIRDESQPSNGVISFVRSAFGRITQPSLWKRRRELRICETLSLGNRNFLAVVIYQDQRFLIAGTPNSISLIADITSEPMPEVHLEKGAPPSV